MEILNANEVDWMLYLNSISGFDNDLVSMRGQYIPIIDLRGQDEPYLWNEQEEEILITVARIRDNILAFFVQSVVEPEC